MIQVILISEPHDLQKAYSIREKVFVQEQKVPKEAEYDQHEEVAHHYLATYNGVPAGAARWRITENGIKLERFAVLSSFRNQEIGSAVLKKVLSDVQAIYPGTTIYLHAQLPAINFYLRHGFLTVGNKFSECDIEHYKMVYTT